MYHYPRICIFFKRLAVKWISNDHFHTNSRENLTNLRKFEI